MFFGWPLIAISHRGWLLQAVDRASNAFAITTKLLKAQNAKVPTVKTVRNIAQTTPIRDKKKKIQAPTQLNAPLGSVIITGALSA
jgi:hypothetical protein